MSILHLYLIVISVAVKSVTAKMEMSEIVEIDGPNGASANCAGNYQFCCDDRPMAWFLANWVGSIVSHSFAPIQAPSLAGSWGLSSQSPDPLTFVNNPNAAQISTKGDFRLVQLFNEIYCHIRGNRGLVAIEMPDPSKLSVSHLKDSAARRLSHWKGYVHNAIRYSRMSSGTYNQSYGQSTRAPSSQPCRFHHGCW